MLSHVDIKRNLTTCLAEYLVNLLKESGKTLSYFNKLSVSNIGNHPVEPLTT